MERAIKSKGEAAHMDIEKVRCKPPYQSLAVVLVNQDAFSRFHLPNMLLHVVKPGPGTASHFVADTVQVHHVLAWMAAEAGPRRAQQVLSKLSGLKRLSLTSMRSRVQVWQWLAASWHSTHDDARILPCAGNRQALCCLQRREWQSANLMRGVVCCHAGA